MEEKNTSENSPNTTATEGTTAPETSQGMSGKALGIIGGILVLVLLGVGAYLYFGDGDIGNFFGTDGTAAEEGAVATVNGEEISREAFNDQVAQVKTSAQQQGADVEGETAARQIQEQALDTLINTELLIQAAADADVTPGDAEINAEYDAIVSQAGGEAALQTRLDELSMTADELRANISDEIAIQAFISTQVSTSSLAVSEAEVQDFYTQVSANQEGLPPLADIRAQIEQQLAVNKQQEAISAVIDNLRAQADIEIFIF